MRFTWLAPALLLPILACAPAYGQEAEPPTDAAHGQMVTELAEVLGQAHWVRILCNGDQDDTWRRYMQDLLELEGRSSGRHGALVGAFNNGYRNMRNSYKDCNDDSRAVEGRLGARGRGLADQLARSYLD